MASPSKGYQVSLAATIEIAGTQVTIQSGGIGGGGGLVFNLPQPVVLGSFDNFIDYLNKELGLPITSADIEGDIDSLPAMFQSALHGLTTAVFTLTVLNINTNTSFYQLGVTMTPTTPISLLGLIAIDSIGVVVGSGVSTTSP